MNNSKDFSRRVEHFLFNMAEKAKDEGLTMDWHHPYLSRDGREVIVDGVIFVEDDANE